MNRPADHVLRRVRIATSLALAGLVAVAGTALTSASDGSDGGITPVAGMAYANTTTTIQGTPTVGETLTANTDAWSPQATSYAFQWFANGTAIDGATQRTLVLAPELAYSAVYVAVTPTKLLYSTDPKFSNTVQVAPATFTNTAKPSVSGTSAVGETLHAETGTWSVEPDSFAYQWFLNGQKVDGATSADFVLPTDSTGKVPYFLIAAFKAGYTTVYEWSTAAPAVGSGGQQPTPSNLTNTSPASISGTLEVGETLTAQEGTWSPAATQYAYQWYLNGAPVADATAKTFVLPETSVGQYVQVLVVAGAPGTGYNPGFYSASGSTAVYPAGASPTASPSTTATATATATASPTSSTTATSTASPTSTTTATATATATTTTTATATATATTTATATATATATTTATATATTTTTATATATATITATPAPKQFTFSSEPRIIGKRRVRQFLTYVAPSMSPAPRVVGFQWLRNGNPIPNATGNRYKVRRADRGKVVRLRVTYARDGYATVTKLTNRKRIL